MAGIILAAGGSTRFDLGPKQLVEWRGEALVRRLAREALAAELVTVVVVLGCEADAVRATLQGLPVILCCNEDWRSGQASSVRCGVETLESLELGGGAADAALFLPVDQPFLDRQLIQQLCDAAAKRTGAIVVPKFQGRRGAPVLFPADLFAELKALRGDVGGRQLLRRHPERVWDLDLEDGRALLDIDTRHDLEALLGESVIGCRRATVKG